MSATVTALKPRESADELWERYSSLMQQAIDDPSLMNDRVHMEAAALAHHVWRKAFLRELGG